MGLVTINSALNPKLWDLNDNLDPDVHDHLLKIARAFYDFIGVKLNIIDVTLTGSSANFTWNDHSDIDLHLILSGMPSDKDRELFNAKKAVWADNHNISIKRMPVECYVQGSAEPHHSTGVYSILNNKWTIVPVKSKPSINDAAVNAKKDQVISSIETALLDKDINKLNRVKQKIVKMRQAGLERAGEWSTENLVFKIIRNLGLLDKITTMTHDLEDSTLSMENMK